MGRTGSPFQQCSARSPYVTSPSNHGLVVARNLGHVDTRMVEKHYGHLTQSFITEAIHASAPRFGGNVNKRVVPLR